MELIDTDGAREMFFLLLYSASSGRSRGGGGGQIHLLYAIVLFSDFFIYIFNSSVFLG